MDGVVIGVCLGFVGSASIGLEEELSRVLTRVYVRSHTQMGFFADAGPVQGIYVNKHVSGVHGPTSFCFKLDGSIGARTPSLTCLSDQTLAKRNTQQMPQDYGFDAQEGVWRTSDMEVEIRSGCGVRMRIVGVDITPGRMVRADGVIDWFRGAGD